MKRSHLLFVFILFQDDIKYYERVDDINIKMKKAIENEVKRLSPYTWGVGIEHEMHLFHEPKKWDGDAIKDVILFDGESAMKRVMEAYKKGKLEMNDEEYKFIKSVPFESTGRLCNGQWVIKKVPFNMPEFITWEPFCNVRMDKTLDEYIDKLITGRRTFMNILSREPITREIIAKNGDLIQYPVSMTRYLKCPKDGSNPKYTFLKKKGANTEHVVRPEYVGSYHLTFTLPHTENTSEAAFIKMHQNFANQLQWLEPLMLTSYFSQDQFACGSKEDRVRGSFRVMIIGWGNFAGSDVRLFNKGIGRYAKSPTHWRKGLKLYEAEKIAPCIPPSPSAIAEGATTTLSSNFRTFGSTDPLRPEHRQSGVGMTKPNGVEFRIFDHFNDVDYISSLTNLIGIVAENSRITKTKEYVYQNKYWIDAMHQIMKYGYKARISPEYRDLLAKMLGINIMTKSLVAYDLFEDVVIQLYKKNYFGDWNKIFHKNIIGKKSDTIGLIIPHVNKMSYILSVVMKLNRKPKLMRAFNKLSKQLNHGDREDQYIAFNTFESYVKKYMGSVWVKEADDLAYMYQHLGYVILEKSVDGTIRQMKVMEKIPIYKNMNRELRDIYSPSNKFFLKSLHFLDV